MDSSLAYEQHAQSYLRERDKSPVGTRIVDQWGRSLRDGARVLELACGGGLPITRTLQEVGLQLWALDSSPTLAAEFQKRFPNIPMQCAKVQNSDFFNQRYEGVVAIGLVFLLTEPDQSDLINRVAGILEPGGRFLFTAPIETGTWRDMNTGIECRSLGQQRYRKLLQNAGLTVTKTYADVGKNNYYDVVNTR